MTDALETTSDANTIATLILKNIAFTDLKTSAGPIGNFYFFFKLFYSGSSESGGIA